MKEDKFVVEDVTDIICIGGFGNLEGNLGLLKYSEKEIAKMIMENNNKADNIRLANSLLGSIRLLETNWKELKEGLEDTININPYDISDYVYENILQDVLNKMKKMEKQNENNK